MYIHVLKVMQENEILTNYIPLYKTPQRFPLDNHGKLYLFRFQYIKPNPLLMLSCRCKHAPCMFLKFYTMED